MLHYLIDPFTVFLLLLALAGSFYLWSRRRWFRAVLIVAGVWLLVITTPFVPNLLLGSLEHRYVPLTEQELEAIEGVQVHVLVLGGGHTIDPRLPPTVQLSGSALKRLVEGIRVYRSLPGSLLIFSGYSSSGRTTQAEMLGASAELLGISFDAYILQKEPANTWQEAQAYKRFVDQWAAENSESPVPTLILVTSAAHMPRAMAMFQELDLDPIPSPAEYRLFKDPEGPFRLWRYLPSTGNIDNMRLAMREYAGLSQFHLFLSDLTGFKNL